MARREEALRVVVCRGSCVRSRESEAPPVDAKSDLDLCCHTAAVAIGKLAHCAPRLCPARPLREACDPLTAVFWRERDSAPAPDDYASATALVINMITEHPRCGERHKHDGFTGSVTVDSAARCNVAVFHAACARYARVHGVDPLADKEHRASCLLAAASTGACDVFDMLLACPWTRAELPWDVHACSNVLDIATRGPVHAGIVCVFLDWLAMMPNGRHVAGVSCLATLVMSAVARRGLTSLLGEMVELVTPEVEREVAGTMRPTEMQPRVRLLCHACSGLSAACVRIVLGRFSYTRQQLRKAYLWACHGAKRPRTARVTYNPAAAAIDIFDVLHQHLPPPPASLPGPDTDDDNTTGNNDTGEDLDPWSEQAVYGRCLDLRYPLQAAVGCYLGQQELVQYLLAPPARDDAWRFPAPDWNCVLVPLYSMLCGDTAMVVLLPILLARRVELSPETFCKVGACARQCFAIPLLAAQPAHTRDACAISMAGGALLAMQYTTLVGLRREMSVEPSREDWERACVSGPRRDGCTVGLPLSNAVIAKCGRVIDGLLDHNYCLARRDCSGYTVYHIFYQVVERRRRQYNVPVAVQPLDHDYDAAIVRLRAAMTGPAAARLFPSVCGVDDLDFVQWLCARFLRNDADMKSALVDALAQACRRGKPEVALWLDSNPLWGLSSPVQDCPVKPTWCAAHCQCLRWSELRAAWLAATAVLARAPRSRTGNSSHKRRILVQPV